MKRLILIAFGALLAWPFLGALADAQTKLVGEPGRVVIIDASGSMSNQSYSGRREEQRRRWHHALLIFDELLQKHRGDGIKTAVHIFGSTPSLAWSRISAAHGGVPSNVKPDHPACEDVVDLAPFQDLTRNSVRSLSALASQRSYGGMTPIHTALIRAIESLDPDEGGDIFLISDLEDPNCLPPNTTVCEMLAPTLAKFDRIAFKFDVFAIGIPSSKLKEQIGDCLPLTEVPHSGDPDKTLKDLDKFLEVRVDITARNSLDPNVIDVTQFGAKLTDPLGNQSNVLLERLLEERGAYTLEIDTGNRLWTVGVDITQPGVIPVTLEPSVLVLSAKDANGQVARLQDVTLTPESGGQTFSLGARSLPDRIPLNSGTYVVTGKLPDGSTATARPTMELGRETEVTLEFTSRPKPPELRDVALRVSVAQPTLPSGRFSPRIVLTGATGPRTLTPGNNVLALPAGAYRVEINGPSGHEIPIEIPSGTSMVQVDVHVVPGWFEVNVPTPARLAYLELLDSQNAVIAKFAAETVMHSLSDGAYRLVYRDADTILADQRVNISAGRQTKLPDF